MRFLSVRDLRGKSAVDETNVEKALTAWRQIRAMQAVAAIQQASMCQGTDSIGTDKIDAEIKESRRMRRKHCS